MQTALNLKANSANPTFTGTLAAQTINATTAFQLNGVNLNTIFQPLFWLWVIIPSSGTNGAVTISTWNGQATAVSASRRATGTYVLSWTPYVGSNTVLFMVMQGMLEDLSLSVEQPPQDAI